MVKLFIFMILSSEINEKIIKKLVFYTWLNSFQIHDETMLKFSGSYSS